MRSGTDTKYYDNVVLSEMMDANSTTWLHHTLTSTVPANSVKSSHALDKAP